MKIKTILMIFVSILTLTLAACDITTTATTATNSTTSTEASVTTTTTDSTTSSLDTTQRTFTLSQLAVYNGNNGSDAYIAVNGIVYDVTDAPEWSNG